MVLRVGTVGLSCLACVLVVACGPTPGPSSAPTPATPSSQGNEATESGQGTGGTGVYHPAPASTGGAYPSGMGGDRDGDGLSDAVDRCPDMPEDFDGFMDQDGCPDPDNDVDGVRDVDDRCPNDPGPAPFGCPMASGGDRDKDGIADASDKCPDDPEDKDGFQDGDGCPDPDNDKDGILDKDDKCPNQPETFNGFQDDDGCPDKKP
jgi:hypothetical protein